jgi:hypothetical protein
MCRNLVLGCLAVSLAIAVTSVPASGGAPKNTPSLAVDINGSGTSSDPNPPGELQTAAPAGWPDWPTWEGWHFDRDPAGGPSWSKTFGSTTITITGVTDDGSGLHSRNRSDPNGGSDQYISNLYKDFIYVQHSSGVGYGADYMKLDLNGLEPNKPYEFTAFNWDAFAVPGTEEVKYVAWGLECPCDYPSYGPTVGGGGQAPKLARILSGGADPCDPNLLDAFHYSGSFTVKTNGNGEMTLYAWADHDSWDGTQHAPLSGFAIGIDPNANNPSPSDGETGVSLTQTLSWAPGFWAQDTNGHDVYFGTDFSEVSDANTSDATGIYLGNTTDPNYQLPTSLQSNVTYYWRVDEINDVNTPGYWKGQMWQFTTIASTITKCTVKAGKTQFATEGPDAGDVSKMKDYFTAAATVIFPTDLNDVNQIDVSIISLTDDYTVYSESIDFNDYYDPVRNRFNYSQRIRRGEEGAITSLKMNFVRNTLAIKAKNVDLTGLRSPLELDIGMGASTIAGEANETIINKRKLIPTRLMRLYDDTLIVTKAKARASTRPSSDSLSVKGDIAVADMELDYNEPDLVTQDVILTWGDVNDTNVQTFTIPMGSFVSVSPYKRHYYKCSKVVMDTNDCDEGVVSAKIDLDKCTFTVSIKNANDLYVGPGDAKFGVSFDPHGFNETDEYTLP